MLRARRLWSPSELLAFGLGLSFLLHAFIFLGLPRTKLLPPIRESKKIHEAVELRLQPRAKTVPSPERVPASAASGKKSAKATPAKPATPARDVVREGGEGTTPEVRSYSALLPSASEVTGMGEVAAPGVMRSHEWPENLPKERRPQVVEQSVSFAQEIDLPLVTRQEDEMGQAIGRIRRDTKENALVLVTLNGQGLLRAALYRFLQQAKAHRILNQLFALSEQSEILVYLHLKSGMEKEGLSADILWRKNALHIYKFRQSKQSVPAMAIQLPDAEADKAKRWDEQNGRDLKSSPAYLSPLENKTLCVACL